MASKHEHAVGDSVMERCVSVGDTPAILADVYQTNINMAIWQRELSTTLQDSIEEILTRRSGLKFAMTLTPENASSLLVEAFGDTHVSELCDDIADIVDMFCCLFDLKSAGLRLAVLNRAMCPRFHVDRVPCRLIMTYGGVATEWLPHALVDRSKLGRGGDGLSDLEAGLYPCEGSVRQLSCGEVALLKGELWMGNEGAGLVHRSPVVADDRSRLVLTLDVGI